MIKLTVIDDGVEPKVLEFFSETTAAKIQVALCEAGCAVKRERED